MLQLEQESFVLHIPRWGELTDNDLQHCVLSVFLLWKLERDQVTLTHDTADTFSFYGIMLPGNGMCIAVCFRLCEQLTAASCQEIETDTQF